MADYEEEVLDLVGGYGSDHAGGDGRDRGGAYVSDGVDYADGAGGTVDGSVNYTDVDGSPFEGDDEGNGNDGEGASPLLASDGDAGGGVMSSPTPLPSDGAGPSLPLVARLDTNVALFAAEDTSLDLSAARPPRVTAAAAAAAMEAAGGLRLDLKGVIYTASRVPLAGTALVISVVGGEARATAALTDVYSLRQEGEPAGGAPREGGAAAAGLHGYLSDDDGEEQLSHVYDGGGGGGAGGGPAEGGGGATGSADATTPGGGRGRGRGTRGGRGGMRARGRGGGGDGWGRCAVGAGGGGVVKRKAGE
ncbi:hypothetical protein MMPV_009904 [Pyropia vietnamensis]